LGILGYRFFFLIKKKEIKKKKKGKKKREIAGWLEPPLAQKWGGWTTPFLAKGWLRSPHTAVWGWPKPPQAFGGGPATPKGHQEKKKKGKNGFELLGVAGPPPRAWGWLRPPPTAQTHFSLFFFFLAFWGGRTTLKGLEVASATPIRPVWGGSSHPAISLFFFFFFFSLNPKKKKKILKCSKLRRFGQNDAVLGKTTPFWAKRRRFG
jgi:hypothetical protein